MFNFLRKIPYYQELKDILAEEEKLLTEWQTVHREATMRSVTHNPEAAWEAQWRQVEDSEFKKLWDILVYMHRESRKLEEIKRFLDAQEKGISDRDRRVLMQLRRKLDWKPLKLKKKEECYVGKTEYFEGTFDKEKYRQLMAEFVYDEIMLWEHLNKEKTRIRGNVVKRVGEYNKTIQEAQRVIGLISKGGPSWTEELNKFWIMCTKEKASERLLNDEHRNFWIRILSDMIASYEKDITFLERALEILKDIENRLNKCKP